MMANGTVSQALPLQDKNHFPFNLNSRETNYQPCQNEVLETDLGSKFHIKHTHTQTLKKKTSLHPKVLNCLQISEPDEQY